MTSHIESRLRFCTILFTRQWDIYRKSRRGRRLSGFESRCSEILRFDPSYLVRLFLQQALAATVGGAVLHLARVALLEPCWHQTPPHRRQHALIHRGFLSDTDKAEVNYMSWIKRDSRFQLVRAQVSILVPGEPHFSVFPCSNTPGKPSWNTGQVLGVL